MTDETKWWRNREDNTPRWKQFIILGAVLLVLAFVFSSSAASLAIVLGVAGGALILAGLIGGAVNGGDDVGPRT